MSNSPQLKPFFITGPTAKITILDEKTNKEIVLGYCMDINCRLDTPNNALSVLGMYEPIAIVPIASSVFGGFSIIRYLKNDNSLGLNTNENGNSFHNISVGDQLEPGNILKLPYFTLNLYKTIEYSTPTNIMFSTIRHCRIINKLYTLQKKAYLVDRYQFMGILSADDGANITESAVKTGTCNHAQWKD